MNDCTLREWRATSVCGAMLFLLVNSGVIHSYCRFWLTAVVLCVSESLVSSVQHLVRSVGQSRGCHCVFVHQTCVAATNASYQVTVAEDELRHPCSTAGDEDFHSAT